MYSICIDLSCLWLCVCVCVCVGECVCLCVCWCIFLPFIFWCPPIWPVGGGGGGRGNGRPASWTTQGSYNSNGKYSYIEFSQPTLQNYCSDKKYLDLLQDAAKFAGAEKQSCWLLTIFFKLNVTAGTFLRWSLLFLRHWLMLR